MGINISIKIGLRILLVTILCPIAFSGMAKGNHPEIALREVYSRSQSEPGEAFYFFIPQTAADKDRYTYVYDTKLDRLLYIPRNKNQTGKIDGREINPADWPRLLKKLILNIDPSAQHINNEEPTRLKVMELDEKWVKFTLGKRHIVLPRELMVEDWGQKNFPLGKEIVDKHTSLPADYVPDDLVKIDQKWNFHGPDSPKYLRRYVAYMIENMLQNAEDQGIHIRLFSAFRTYEKQRFLYLKAVSRYGANQNGVAKQGHSEHQLGTTVDLCGLDPKSVLDPNFDRTREGRWLKENSPRFGFSQSYTKKNQDLMGYMPEPWHYRYYGNRQGLPHTTFISDTFE
jgi:LAS superfamily LD-carboxypeptidase LdcB